MQRYLAFLRAVNVGGRTVRMERLRGLFESLGLDEVESFIASGNVIFRTGTDADPAALESRIERHLEKELGFEVDTFLRTPAEVAAIAAYDPFPGEDGARSIGFLKRPPEPGAEARLAALGTDVDALHLRGREVVWLCRTRVSLSKLVGGTIERALGASATLRSVTTVRKLAAKYPPVAGQ